MDLAVTIDKEGKKKHNPDDVNIENIVKVNISHLIELLLIIGLQIIWNWIGISISIQKKVSVKEWCVESSASENCYAN